MLLPIICLISPTVPLLLYDDHKYYNLHIHSCTSTYIQKHTITTIVITIICRSAFIILFSPEFSNLLLSKYNTHRK
ncbi:unnamed protein product [Brugia timori]|uniref:G_PROTEIN_RECEP_F1_2 domain-containing protein n=1 Tax=Brugia timori TaxID=42155 RepID=A0A0R3R060_9BILA|nr:unnamed protein product [Brugia timori]